MSVMQRAVKRRYNYDTWRKLLNTNDSYLAPSELSIPYHCGSLLGVAVNREKYSFPIRKVDRMTLYPLDFEEFLMILDKVDRIELIRKHHSSDEEFSLHETALDLYRTYLVVGEMPATVLEYIKKRFRFYLDAALNSIKGVLTENYVATALVCDGYVPY